jgi:hypothetical protein
MSTLVPSGGALPSDQPTILETVRNAGARRQLDRLRDRTMLRLANVQGQGIVASEKVKELESTSREAMTGQAMLYNWANTVANGDPVLRDDMGFFQSLYRAAAGEVIADLSDTYCRESRS